MKNYITYITDGLITSNLLKIHVFAVKAKLRVTLPGHILQTTVKFKPIP